MEEDIIVRTGNDVTVVVSRTVFPGFEDEYDEWVKEIVKAASEAKGNTGVTTLIPQRGKTGLYHVLFRFKDQASVEAWENSEVRRKLTLKADAFPRSTARLLLDWKHGSAYRTVLNWARPPTGKWLLSQASPSFSSLLLSFGSCSCSNWA